MKFKLLIVFSLLITGSAYAMDSAGSSAIKHYVVNGQVYDLHPNHAVTFVWRDGTRCILSARQVIKLNSAFIWTSLRARGDGFAEESDIVADHFMTPDTYLLLRLFLDRCFSIKLTEYGDRASRQERVATNVEARPMRDFLNRLSGKDVIKILIACDFLQVPDIASLIKQLLIDKYSIDPRSFGCDQDAIDVLEMTNDIPTPNENFSVDYRPCDPVWNDVDANASFLLPHALPVRFVRTRGNNYVHINHVEFSTDNRYTITYEPDGPRHWRRSDPIAFQWPLPNQDLLIATTAEGTHQVWQLSDTFSDLTITQRLFLRHAFACHNHELSWQQCRTLRPIYRSLPEPIKHIIPNDYKAWFEGISWLLYLGNDLTKFDQQHPAIAACIEVGEVALVGTLYTALYLGHRYPARFPLFARYSQLFGRAIDITTQQVKNLFRRR